MNLGKSNINEVSAFIEFAKSYGINQAATLLIAKIGRGKDYPDAFDYKESILEIAEIVEELKSKQEEEKGEIDFAFSNLDEQRGCAIFGSGPLKCVPRVTPSGDVFFCSYFFGEENVLGNIKNQSLMDILESKTSKKFIELVRLRKNNQKCSKCLFSDFCMCGCPAVSYMHTENLFETSDQCEMIKYFIKKQIIKNN